MLKILRTPCRLPKASQKNNMHVSLANIDYLSNVPSFDLPDAADYTETV